MTHTEYRLTGCPGSGKTTALARSWIPRAVERWGAQSVAVCSLTKAAAAEIASRDSGIPKEQVGTMHALCFRALGRPEVAEGKIKEWNELYPYYQLSEGDSDVDEPDVDTRLAGRDGDKLMARSQVLRHRMEPQRSWPSDVLAFHEKWKSWCLSNGYMDFTGMIEAALESVPVAPGAPKVLIADETQDSSALELALLRRWAESAEYVVLASDPMQAIYAWRGADPEALLGHAIPKENDRFLSQSHRCSIEVRNASVAWAARLRNKLPLKFEARPEHGRVVQSDAFLGYAETALKHIGDGTTMFLASCGFQVDQVVRALRAAGIPFHNPWRRTNGRWNPLRGGGRRLADFLRPDAGTYGEHARLWSWGELKSWTEGLDAKCGAILPGAKKVVDAFAKAEVEAESAKHPTPAELRQHVFTEDGWGTLRAAFEVGHLEALKWVDARLLDSWRPRYDYALRVARRGGGRALVDEPKVSVGTIHSCKGAEANRVVVFPDLSPSGMREWCGSARDHDAIVRLFYVALTRARDELVLATPSGTNCVDW